MRILFTNDDGYDSEGLHAVADLFKGHDIAVVAPDTQKSGFSHSLTLHPQLLSCKEISGYGYKTYAVGGTPVDCVKFGASTLFGAPDMVISGINRGRNLGSDVMYSGTISAAADAAHLGFRAIALSLDCDKPTRADFARFAEFVHANFDALAGVELPPKTFLNINHPDCAPRGVKVCKMSTLNSFVDVYDCVQSDIYMPHGHRCYDMLDPDTDEAYCGGGYITVSPLTVDRTDYSTLEKIKRTSFAL